VLGRAYSRPFLDLFLFAQKTVQGHIAAKAETASQLAPQNPIDRSSVTMSAAPGASLGIASRAAASG